ncbi:long-chain fatty acid--CoA ligase [Gilvimarinus sp. F26214L]|uniref:long-chain fatty acid--CoA ligase n=1 Tax=Gilvimarinus sp. DZF01 TaxID=3461371 RepID=UPI0040453BED
MDTRYLDHWPKHLPRDIALPNVTIWENLDITTRRYADRTAIKFFGNDISYRKLYDDVDALAGWLQQVGGVQKGDRVLLYMQNCPQFVMGYYAILRADAVVIPVNPMNREDEFQHYIKDTDAKVAICASELAGFAKNASDMLPEVQQLQNILVAHYADALPDEYPHPEDAPPAVMKPLLDANPELPAGAVTWKDALAAAHKPGPHTARPDDLAVMPYTSGTTGFPKGCMHTHKTVMHTLMVGSLANSSTADAISLSVLPLFHVTGMQYGMNTPIYMGGTVVMLPRWDREVAGSYVSRYGVTHWTAIPTMIIDLFGSPNIDKFDFSSLRYIGGGGAAMPQAVAKKVQDTFGLDFLEGYGLSETIAPTHTNPMYRPKRQCLGIPTFGTTAVIIDPETLKPLPQGETGEIAVHGPQVMLGYWRNEEASEQVFFELDGKRFFRTGDLGKMDEEGYFFITDRLKRMINASGFKVWPAEVEALLYNHPDIQEACIIGSKDPYRGETVKAVVVLMEKAKGKVSEEDIINWSKEHMAAYKTPKIVEFVDALPKSGSGKVMWRILQEEEYKRTENLQHGAKVTEA